MLQAIGILGVALLIWSIKELTISSVIFSVIISSCLFAIVFVPFFLSRILKLKSANIKIKGLSFIEPIIGILVGSGLFMYSIKILRNFTTFDVFKSSYLTIINSVNRSIFVIGLIGIIALIARILTLIAKNKESPSSSETS